MSFWDAERLARRAERRYGLGAGATTAVLGTALSGVLSPLLLAAVMLGFDVANLVTPTPDLFPLHGASSHQPATPLHVSLVTVAVLISILVIPGVAALLVCWIGVRNLLRREAVGPALLVERSRPVELNRAEERQLENVVTEMAIAAGWPWPPGVQLTDSDSLNAVAVGRSPRETTLIVTAGLLKVLDREQTLAVVAYLIASATNGDVAIGTTIASLYATLGLVKSSLGAGSDRKARAVLAQLLRLALGRDSSVDDATILDCLTSAEATPFPSLGALGVGAPRQGVQLRFMGPRTADSTAPPSTLSWSTLKPALASMLVIWVTFPLAVAGRVFDLTQRAICGVVVTPLWSRAWRARRQLTDATAVEFTRDPEALASAITVIESRDPACLGPGWYAHMLFADTAGCGATKVPLAYFRPREERLSALASLGATLPASDAGARSPRRPRLVRVVLAVVAVPAVAAAVPLLAAVALITTAMGFVSAVLFLAIPLLLHGGLRAVGR